MLNIAFIFLGLGLLAFGMFFVGVVTVLNLEGRIVNMLLGRKNNRLRRRGF